MAAVGGQHKEIYSIYGLYAHVVMVKGHIIVMYYHWVKGSYGWQHKQIYSCYGQYVQDNYRWSE